MRKLNEIQFRFFNLLSDHFTKETFKKIQEIGSQDISHEEKRDLIKKYKAHGKTYSKCEENSIYNSIFNGKDNEEYTLLYSFKIENYLSRFDFSMNNSLEDTTLHVDTGYDRNELLIISLAEKHEILTRIEIDKKLKVKVEKFGPFKYAVHERNYELFHMLEKIDEPEITQYVLEQLSSLKKFDKNNITENKKMQVEIASLKYDFNLLNSLESSQELFRNNHNEYQTKRTIKPCQK